MTFAEYFNDSYLRPEYFARSLGISVEIFMSKLNIGQWTSQEVEILKREIGLYDDQVQEMFGVSLEYQEPLESKNDQDPSLSTESTDVPKEKQFESLDKPKAEMLLCCIFGEQVKLKSYADIKNVLAKRSNEKDDNCSDIEGENIDDMLDNHSYVYEDAADKALMESIADDDDDIDKMLEDDIQN